MGIIIAKFRKKISTYDILTKLEDEIISIEEFQKRTQQTQRKIVFRFIFLAIVIYAALAFLLYLYFSQISQNQKLLWSIPLVAFPLMIWLIKKFLTWYYNRKLIKNEKKLVTLKEKKKKILENVMETETYKVAKQILDKFGNEQKKPIIATPFAQKSTPLGTPKAGESVIRQRPAAAKPLAQNRLSFGLAPVTPLVNQQQLALPTPNQRTNSISQLSGSLIRSPAVTPLPRNILPRDRSVLDKMVDYLVGDGPSNRYALICQKCSSHNGMALKEEFEYISFRCCYCSHFNSARKKKPVGPKFEAPVIPPRALMAAESSDSEKSSGSDSDREPLIEELKDDTDQEDVPSTDATTEESKMEVDDIGNNEESAETAKAMESGDAIIDLML
ncbi:hypothetical protein GWI33_022778 [Rhynchophorus ferrugineus]|uniref:Endoplasmic reticulum junction formation protein lunapark n=1 Tax=Rhynchophorus ferrugineus TaxID=354439 RepID=A0A834IS11_RHYFE|nr:hypothetical protein GWI33_022778 [Rhynchophorus ferrugineus]